MVLGNYYRFCLYSSCFAFEIESISKYFAHNMQICSIAWDGHFTCFCTTQNLLHLSNYAYWRTMQSARVDIYRIYWTNCVQFLFIWYFNTYSTICRIHLKLLNETTFILKRFSFRLLRTYNTIGAENEWRRDGNCDVPTMIPPLKIPHASSILNIFSYWIQSIYSRNNSDWNWY